MLRALLGLSLLLMAACAGDVGEHCGQDAGCMSGLFCQGDAPPGWASADSGQCAGSYPDGNGICQPQREAFETCEGFLDECAPGLRCVAGVCQSSDFTTPDRFCR